MDEITARTGGMLTAGEEAERLDREIKAEAANVASALLRIGRALKRMNDGGLYKELGYSSLGEYSSAAVGLQERAAYNYIKCYETYGEEFLERHEKLGLTKLIALTQLNDVDRKELLESGNLEGMTTRELQDTIRELKTRCEQLTFALEEQKTPVEVIDAPKMSEAEKEEIRKALAIEAEMRHAEEVKEAEEAVRAEMQKSIDQREEKIRAANAELEKLKKDEKAAKDVQKAAETAVNAAKKKQEEAENEQKKLQAEIDALKSANAKLQANTAAKPAPSGNKELLKYHAENFAREFTAAVEVAKRFEGEERGQFRNWLITTAANMGKAAESI